eukprot:gene1132-2194_t
MQLRHLKALTPPNEGMVKVTALCWSPNGKKLAVCTTERVVLMFDEEGKQKDKFSTKPADKGPKNYIVRQMVFSQQSDRLAIAQSDNMVFIYKIGTEWGDKKSICNKFHHTSPITSIVWPSKRPNEVVYGLAEGKVKVGQLKTHKPANLYQTDNTSYVTAICCNPTGNAVCSAHLDGSIYTYWFDSVERGAHLIVRHGSVPFALTWGGSIVVAGSDCQVTFYDEDGGEENSFDYSKDSRCREFTAATTNPTGDAVVLGNYDSLYTFARNKDTMGWEQKDIKIIENMYSATALDWKSDGSRLAVGTLCGVVDLYDVCVKRSMYKGGFEMTYVSQSQVIIRQIETNARMVVRSQYGFEIIKINIYQKRFVVANTIETLLLGDMETLKMSEIQWHGDGSEKFIFDNPLACVVYFAEELSIIEYGMSELLGSVRTPNINSHVLSLRINERQQNATANSNENNTNNINSRRNRDDDRDDNKKIAFLLDAQTICIKDLVAHSSVNIPHDNKIDWLELNERGNLLLFRDKKRFLHLYNIQTQERSQLLNFCTYVQWVPNSDVVVAQNRNNLCVWYNIHAPDQITNQPIKGDIENIERLVDEKGRSSTIVVVDEGLAQAEYPLDEGLINFGSAMDDRNYTKAMDILEGLEMTPESEAMWRQLNLATVNNGDLLIAERCAAAVGDIASSMYLHNVNIIKIKAENDGIQSGKDHYLVRSKLLLLKKEVKAAEEELIDQGKEDECIEMYQKLHKQDAAIRVAENARHPELVEMRQAYFQYLLDTNQEEQAAALKVHECDFTQAIQLYLKGGMPAKAAEVVLSNGIKQQAILENVAGALSRANMHDRAGEFYELLEELPRALESYTRGNAYRQAVDLARRTFPGRVVELEEKWGDYLVSQKQIDMAINHYIEAKASQKAIEAALNARQHARALQLLDTIGSHSFNIYYKQLAMHYEKSGQYENAEKCYISADLPQLAVEMLTNLGRWDRAHKLATSYMSESEVGVLYISQAQRLEQDGKFKEAERLYLTVKEKDLAINMYKKHKRFDDMIRLVQEHRPDLLKETHQFLAQTLEMDGSLREAEHHYVEAGEWHSAVNMYRSNEMWDDAIRVAKFYGGINACKRVTIALLMAVGVAEGSKHLIKHGLIEAAIEHATENGAFDMAFELANQNFQKKLPEIHLKHALFLEDDERFKEAEEEFIKAGKPKEAIDMYTHQQDWESALRVAENNDPAAVPDVYIAHAKVKCESEDLKTAEELYLDAARPDLALSMYQELGNWQEAMRIAQMHLPHRVAEINAQFNSAQARTGKGGSKNDYLTSGRQFEQSKQWKEAIDAYMAAQKDSLESIADLEEIWDRAIEIARNYMPNKYVDIGLEVSRRLISLERDETAADVLFDIGRHEEAINVCITARKFEKAKALAQGNIALKRKVDEAYQGHLVVNEDAKELMEMGRSDAALDVLARRGDWDQLWESAAKERLSSNVLGKYVLQRVEELMKEDRMAEIGTKVQRVDEAIRTLQKRQGLISDGALSTYKKLTMSILGRTKEEESLSDQAVIVASLREVLFKIASLYRAQAPDKRISPGLEMLLMSTHYQHMFYTCRSQGLKDTAVKCAVTMMKYPDIFPQDKAFYQAGLAARECLPAKETATSTSAKDSGAVKDREYKNLAFMLWNRYIDLSEAIETNDSSFMDNTEYNDTDAVPLDVSPGQIHYLSEDAREEVRTWVLSVVTDSSIQQRFPRREQARNTIYEGLFLSERPTCIVTGYPVYPADILEVNNSTANRKDWNAYVAKLRTCPWTGQSQNPIY